MLIVDCHAHVYSPDEERYQPTQNPLRVPGGGGSAEDLGKISRANGGAAVRAVQTVSFYGYDNRYLCDVARVNPDWVSGVCTLDPDDPHSPGYLQRHCQRKVARTEFSTDDRELGRPELTPLGKRGGAVELEIVS